MRLAHDIPDYKYQGYFGANESVARLRIYRPDEGENHPPVVIMTELPENTGTSITNMCEVLAAKMLLTFLQDRMGKAIPFIYVEQYATAEGVRNYSTYDIVGFDNWIPNVRRAGGMRLGKPTWLPLAFGELLELVHGAGVAEYMMLDSRITVGERRSFADREAAITSRHAGGVTAVLAALGYAVQLA